MAAEIGHDSIWADLGRFFAWGDAGEGPLGKVLNGYEEGRLEAALVEAEKALHSSPDAPERDAALLLRGLSAFGLGDDSLAASSFERILESDPVSPHYVRALLYAIEGRHRRGRFAAVADAWGRYFEKPWAGKDRRGRVIRGALLSAGTRRLGRWLRGAEIDRLVGRARSERWRDFSLDRAAYLAGTAFYRIGRYAESVAALEHVPFGGPFFPYALFTGAQALARLGESERAVEVLRWLERSPSGGVAGRALTDRASALLAKVLFESGRPAEARATVVSLMGRGAQAKWLAARVSIDADEPALAILAMTGPSNEVFPPAAAAEAWFLLSAAHEKLGDLPGAVAALESAAASVGAARARLETSRRTLRDLLAHEAEEDIRRRAGDDMRRRQDLADTIRRAVALERLPFWKRVLHRLLGAPVRPYREPGRLPTPASLDGLWLTYLGSPRRPAIERGLLRGESRQHARLLRDIAGVVDDQRLALLHLGLRAESATAKLRQRQWHRLAALAGSKAPEQAIVD